MSLYLYVSIGTQLAAECLEFLLYRIREHRTIFGSELDLEGVNANKIKGERERSERELDLESEKFVRDHTDIIL
jgi:hypothetical protein